MLYLRRRRAQGHAMNATLTDQAEITLREQIFSGRILPGTRYTEAELAAHLGLSRTPVREAALRLQTAGLVSIRPRRGITICSVTIEDMAHIYEVLTALEIVAVGRVAARHPHGKGDLAPLQRAIANMSHALSARDMGTWARADEDFHRALMELSGNPELVTIFERYTDRVRRARLATMHHRPLPTASLDCHTAVLAAIEAGDITAAQRLHAEHLNAARSLLTELIRSHGTSQV